METYLSVSFEGNRGEFNSSEILNFITQRSHASGAGRLHRDVTAFSYFHLHSLILPPGSKNLLSCVGYQVGRAHAINQT